MLDDIIEVENLQGGRVKCEDKMLIVCEEFIGKSKDNIFIRSYNPNL